MIIFDLDGTLADIEHRKPLVDGIQRNEDTWAAWHDFFNACVNDKPNKPVIEMFRAMRHYGRYDIEIWSGRSDLVLTETQAWLTEHVFGNEHWKNPRDEFHYCKLRMRPMNDWRTDVELKAEWLNGAISKVVLAVDDRQCMVDFWRSKGIVCAQVAKGDY
jgi:FMN phosphatase YigB (HAD superfamily)